MIPVLFEQDEKEFRTNGIGRLSDCMTGIVSERLNEFYTLDMTYPTSGQYADELIAGRIILALPADGEPTQPFRIREVDRTLEGIITVQADHLSYDLAGYPVAPFTASSASAAVAHLSSSALIYSGFNFSTDISSNESFAVLVPMSIREAMGGDESILSVYGGEYAFNRYDVELKASRGKDNGVTIRHKKNMTELTVARSMDGYYTGAIAYYEKDGTVVRSAVQYGSSSESPQRILITDHSEDFESTPSTSQLNTLAAADLEAASGKMYAVTAAFAPIWQSDEYIQEAVAERVALGDMVRVVHEEYQIDRKMKVVQTDFNFITERYESIELGEIRPSLADKLAGVLTGDNGSGSSATAQTMSACKARGTNASATSGTSATQIQITVIKISSDPDNFSISDGGIKVAKDGLYEVSGAAYITPASGTTTLGTYIFKGSSFSSATEQIGCLQGYGSSGARSVPTGPVLINIAAGDIIFLASRCRGAAGTCDTTHMSTFLQLRRLGERS